MMNIRQGCVCVLGLLGLLSSHESTTWGETTAQQQFTVHVPARISITAPDTQMRAELLPEQPHISFEPQSWDVASNSRTGATVQFSTDHCFQNVDDPAIQRDAQLEVSLLHESRPGTWAVTQPKATTSYLENRDSASVQIRSSRPGRATIGLTVTLLQDDALSTPGGDYVTTVIGTITSD